VVDGHNGFIVPIGDHRILADKILYCLKDRQAMVQMGKRGQEIASRYTVERGLDQLEAVYSHYLRHQG